MNERDARRSLALRVGLPMIPAVVAAVVFAELADEVHEGATARVDRAISLWIHGFDTPALDVVMRAFTWLGSGWVLAGMVVAAGAWAWWRQRRALAGVILATGVAAWALNTALKLLFHRARPNLFIEIVAPSSYSFPSGHAMVSTAVYGVLALVVGRFAPAYRRMVYAGASALVLLIGLSRIYLGVHWATDVVGGFAAGGMLIAAAYLALRWATR